MFGNGMAGWVCSYVIGVLYCILVVDWRQNITTRSMFSYGTAASKRYTQYIVCGVWYVYERHHTHTHHTHTHTCLLYTPPRPQEPTRARVCSSPRKKKNLTLPPISSSSFPHSPYPTLQFLTPLLADLLTIPSTIHPTTLPSRQHTLPHPTPL